MLEPIFKEKTAGPTQPKILCSEILGRIVPRDFASTLAANSEKDLGPKSKVFSHFKQSVYCSLYRGIK